MRVPAGSSGIIGSNEQSRGSVDQNERPQSAADGYLDGRKYYEIGTGAAGDIDNPDQRIAEDVSALREEIAMLLAAFGDRVEDVYHALYPNGVAPSGWGMTVEGWLRRVSQLATDHSLGADQRALL